MSLRNRLLAFALIVLFGLGTAACGKLTAPDSEACTTQGSGTCIQLTTQGSGT